MGLRNAPRLWALLLWSSGLLVSAGIGWWAHADEQQRARELLEDATAEIAQRIEERFRLYEYGLRGARGAVVATGGVAVTRHQFEAYVSSRNMGSEFPGARGFGFIRRVPLAFEADFLAAARTEGPSDFAIRQLGPQEGERFVIQYIYPKATNQGATGLDIASEDNRRQAALQAARTGLAQLTAPITLVQADGLARRGLLFLLPVQAPVPGSASEEQREAATYGWTYAPLVVDEVLAQLGPHTADLGLTLSDGQAGEPFFTSNAAAGGEADGPTTRRSIELYGRQWQLEVRALPSLLAQAERVNPVMLAGGGALVSTLMALLLYLLLNQRGPRESDAGDAPVPGARHPVDVATFARTPLARQVLLVYLLAAMLLLVLAHQADLQHRLEQFSLQLRQTADAYVKETQVRRDFRRKSVQFLASTPPVDGLIRARANNGVDPRERSTASDWELRLQQILMGYIATMPDVIEARMLAIEGTQTREVVRVERVGDDILPVAAAELRERPVSAYQRMVQRMAPGQVMLSDIGLHRPDGFLAMPVRSVARYSAPLYDSDGASFGLMEVAVDARRVSQEIAVPLAAGAQLYITNGAGDYLASPFTARNYGFEYGQPQRWQDDFSPVVARGTAAHRGTSRWQAQDGVYLVATGEARANEDSDIGTLRFHLALPEQIVADAVWSQSTRRVALAALGLGFFGLLTYLFWMNRQRRHDVRNQRLRLAAIVEQTNDAIIGLDAAGTVTSWNRGAQQLFGYSATEAVGHHIEDLVVPPEDENTTVLDVSPLAGAGEVPRMERWLHTRDGRRVEVAITLSPILTGDGRDAGASAIVRDITDERAAQRRVAELNAHLETQVRERTASLSAERERLDNIIRGTNSGTWEWNVQTGERHYNERWAGMLGYTLADLGTLPNTTWLDLVHPQDKELSSAALRRHFSGEIDQYECELRMRHRLGHWIWVLDRGRVTSRTVDGQPEWMYGTHRDITAAKEAQQRLAASEALLNRTGRVAGVGGWQFDLRNWTVVWTPQMYVLHEVASDFEVAADAPLAFYEGEARQRVMQALRRARKEGLPFDFEVPFRSATGRRLMVRLVGEPVYDAQGRVVQIVGAVQDVTDRHAMEAELRRANELQNSMLENMPSAISAFDSELRLVAWNSQFVRLLELEPLFDRGVPSFEDIVRYNAARGEYGPGNPEAQVESLMERARNPIPHRFERVRPNGVPVEIRGTPMPGGGFVTTYMDMSERKRAEQSIARSEALLRGAIDAVDEAFVLFDPEDRLVICNEKYRSLYKDVRDLLVPGTPFETIIRASGERGQNPAAKGRIEAYVAERMAVHRQSDTTFVQKLSDGRVVRVIENRMPDGHTVGFRIDITDLVRATEAAEAASRAKGEFLANMSHEIRTPLHAVIGLSHLLADTPLTARQQQLLSKSQMASHSLLGIVNDVLDMAKIEAGALTLEDAGFSPAALLAELDAVFRQQAEAKGLCLKIDGAPDLPAQVRGDAMRLRQVVTNLLGNALKFTEAGHVGVTLSVLERDAAAGTVRLRGEVTDSGEGIPLEAQARLFTPFSQADASTSRRYGGTGLGLSIVRRLVELMGGSIGVVSQPGQGSCFWFEVMLQLDDQPVLSGAASQAIEVLVVDDVPAERQALVDMARAFGWRTASCESGEALLAWIEQRMASGQPLPDALLVDWQMQGENGRGMDGLQALGNLAERFGLHNLPATLMVSAAERERVASLDHLRLADDILTKPVNASVLFNAVNQGVAGRHGHSGRVMAAQRPPGVVGQRLHGARVLVVDDSEINQEIAQHMLQREGAVVYLAGNGREALSVLREAPQGFDAVLMDVQMPEMDGLQATTALRADTELSHLPVIALTAGALAEERRRALDAGMDDFLTKPLDPEQLIATLLAVMSHRGVNLAPVAAAGTSVALPALPAEWPVIDGIDSLQAAHRLGNDIGLMRRSLRRLIDEFAPMADEPLPTDLDASTRSTLAARVHKLRGAAGLIDALALHRCATLVETGLRDGLDFASLAQAWLQMQAALRRLRMSSAQWLAEQGAAPVKSAPAVEPLRDDELARLIKLLSRHDLDALSLYEARGDALRQRLGEPAVKRLGELIETLDFAAAAELVQQEVAR